MRIIKTILKDLTFCFINLLVGFFGLFIPKSKRIVIFGSWFGQRFADNSKALFLQLQNDNRFKKVIWITKNKDVLKEVRGLGFKAYYSRSLKSVWYHYRAKTHIVDQEAKDLNRFFSIRARKLNLYHGIIALKKVGIYASKTSLSPFQIKLKKAGLFSPGCWANNYYLSTSQFGGEKLTQSFLLKKNHIVYASYPRHKFEASSKPKFLEIANGKKVFFYLPTFRNNNQLDINQFLKNMNDFCLANDCYFAYKPHFVEKIETDKNNLERIILIDKKIDVNDILPFFDVLITDYSSVCWDAIALKKTTLFFSYDLDTYLSEDRGFYCDYPKTIPQEFLLKTENDLVNKMQEIAKCSGDYFEKNGKSLYEWQGEKGKQSCRGKREGFYE